MTTFDFGGAGTAQEPPASNLVPEINFDAYGRQVNIFLSGAQKQEFEALTDELEKLYGTKNVTDTVMEALRRAKAAEAPIEF
jgi:hypothetical protein